jgi:hypothetical protein
LSLVSNIKVYDSRATWKIYPPRRFGFGVCAMRDGAIRLPGDNPDRLR